MVFKFNSKAKSHNDYILNMKPETKGTFFIVYSKKAELWGKIIIIEKDKDGHYSRITINYSQEEMLEFLLANEYDLVKIYKTTKIHKQPIDSDFEIDETITLSLSAFLKTLLETCNNEEILLKTFNEIPEYLV